MVLALHISPEDALPQAAVTAHSHNLCNFFPPPVTLLLVNIFSGFFQQPSIYLPSSFLGSSSAHSFCCIGAMSSSQSLFFGFVPLSTSLSVLESRFPARNPLGSVLKVLADRNHCKHNSCSCTRTHGCPQWEKQHIQSPRNRGCFFGCSAGSL